MRADEIISFDALARANFIYRGDGMLDTWRSSADAALAGEHWTGDCDDLASTVLDLLGRGGVPLVQRYRLFVDTNGDGKVNHMVGAVQDAAKGFWIVGDTGQPAFEAFRMLYTPISYQRLDEWTTGGDAAMRAGAPWRF
jgi:hypothetical protein